MARTKHIKCVSWLNAGLSKIGARRRAINRCCKEILKIEKQLGKHVSIAVSGVSGLSIGSMVAYELKRELIVVRKKEETLLCHSSNEVENLPDRPYVIIDDLIASGSTIKRIVKTIDSMAKVWRFRRTKPIAIIIYDTYHYNKEIDASADKNSKQIVPVINACPRPRG